MGRHKSNFAHKYFRYNAVSDTSMCTLCQLNIKGNHGTNLKKHFAATHSKEFKITDEETKSNKQKQVKLLEIKDLNKIKVKLTMKDLIDAAVEMVTVNGRPFSSIDDTGLRKIIDPIIQSMKPGDRKTINSNSVKKYLHDEAEKIRLEIANEVEGKCVSLKVDAATRLNRSFLGINLQYINEGVIKLRTIGLVEIKEAHTGVFLQHTILDVLDRFRINSKQIYRITTDNGANMVKAVKLIQNMESENLEENALDEDEPSDSDNVEEEDCAKNEEILAVLEDIPDENDTAIFAVTGIRCVAHTLQLCVVDFLRSKDMDKMLNKVRALVRKLRNPTYLYVIKKENLKAPILDCLTRWHSSVDMLLRVVELKTIISNLTDTDPKLKFYKLNHYDWEQIKATIDVLMPAKICTKKLQSEQLTLSDFYGAWVSCKMQVLHVDSKNNNFSRVLYDNMCKREEKIMNHEVILGALFLDPRFNVILNESQQAVAIKHLVRVWNHIEELRTQSQNNQDSTSAVEMQSTGSSDESDELEKFLKSISTTKEIEHTTAVASNSKFSQIECILRNFSLQQRRLSHKVDILKFWEGMKMSSPELYQLSLVIFAVPATQTSVERLFSGLRFVLSVYRTNITGTTLENQLLVRTNRIFEKRYSKSTIDFDLKFRTVSSVDVNDNDTDPELDLGPGPSTKPGPSAGSGLPANPGVPADSGRNHDEKNTKKMKMQQEKDFMSKFVIKNKK